jgi:RNA polymerase sigma-70 factor (ECF subfamily)
VVSPHPASAPLTRAPPAADLTEAVRRAQEGDADAFEVVYRAHAGRVYALCVRMAGDAFGTWLHRLAVNVILMDARLVARRVEEWIERDESEARQLPSREAPAGLRMDLDQAIASLPPMARQVLVLYDVEGYEHREIGTLLGIAVGTSKAHLFRARRMLREKLQR